MKNAAMNSYVVWVEMNEAKVFKISRLGKTSRILRRHEVKHHTNRDPENHKDCEKFFHEIAGELQDAEDILLIGPRLTKEHFKAHLKRHHHDTVAKKVVGTMTMNITSDAGLMACAREFFKIHDLYEHPITA